MSSLLPGGQIYTLDEVEEINPGPIKIGGKRQKKTFGVRKYGRIYDEVRLHKIKLGLQFI